MTVWLETLWQILNDPEASDVIYWNANGNGFIIKSIQEFEQRVLPIYYKHSRYSSFLRSLCYYNFIRVTGNGDSCEYCHNDFHRNKPHSVHEIQRKPSSSTKGGVMVPGMNSSSSSFLASSSSSSSSSHHRTSPVHSHSSTPSSMLTSTGAHTNLHRSSNHTSSGTRTSSRLRKRPYTMDDLGGSSGGNGGLDGDLTDTTMTNNDIPHLFTGMNGYDNGDESYDSHQQQHHHHHSNDNLMLSMMTSASSAHHHPYHGMNNGSMPTSTTTTGTTVNGHHHHHQPQQQHHDHESYYQQLQQQQQYYQSHSHSPHIHSTEPSPYHFTSHPQHPSSSSSASDRTSPTHRHLPSTASLTSSVPQGRPRSNSDTTAHAAYLLAIATMNNNNGTNGCNDSSLSSSVGHKRIRSDGTFIENAILPGLPTPTDGLDRATSMGVILNNENGTATTVTASSNVHSTSPHLAPVSDGLQRQLSAFSMAMLPEAVNSYSNQASIDIGNALDSTRHGNHSGNSQGYRSQPMERISSASSTSAISTLTAMASMILPEHMNSATSITNSTHTPSLNLAHNRTSPLTSPSVSRSNGNNEGLIISSVQRYSGGNGGGNHSSSSSTAARVSPLTSPNAYRTNKGNHHGSTYANDTGFTYSSNGTNGYQASPSSPYHHHHQQPPSSFASTAHYQQPTSSTSPTSLYTQAGLMGPPSAGLDLGRATSLGLSSILMVENNGTLNNNNSTTTTNNNGNMMGGNTSPLSDGFTTNPNGTNGHPLSPLSQRNTLGTSSSNSTRRPVLSASYGTQGNPQLNAPPPLLQISASFSSLADAAERESSVGFNPSGHTHYTNRKRNGHDHGEEEEEDDDGLSVVNTPHVDATPVVV